MKEYGSIPRLLDDGTLKGEQVVAFNKLDGQNFRVKYMAKGQNKNQFTTFGSRRQLVDDSTENFNNAIRYFKDNCEEPLRDIIVNNSGKKGIFNGVEEITCFFEWYGDKSFAGFHQEGDTLRLALIDVFLKKKGYVEPNEFIDLFFKEGVVIKRSTLLKGQRLPMCKVKTKWWLEQLHSRFPKEMWKELE